MRTKRMGGERKEEGGGERRGGRKREGGKGEKIATRLLTLKIR